MIQPLLRSQRWATGIGTVPTLVKDAVDNGYAYAGGHVTAPASDELLDPAAFFAALRAGWTLAEAVAIATPKINSNLRIIGDPLGTLPTPLQGYNVYQRLTPTGADTLVKVVPAGNSGVTLTEIPANAERYYHVKAVSKFGREDDEPVNRIKRRRVATDGSANFIDPVPNAVHSLRLERTAGGGVTAKWAYTDAGQAVAPATFNVYVSTGATAFDVGTPTHQVSYGSQRSFSQALGTFADGLLVRVAVTAVSAAGDEQTIRRFAEIGADAVAPDAAGTMDVEVTNA